MSKRLKHFKNIQTKTTLDGIGREIEILRGKIRKINTAENDLLMLIEKQFRKTIAELEDPSSVQGL